MIIDNEFFWENAMLNQVVKGDGIGPEIVREAMKVLDLVGEGCDATELCWVVHPLMSMEFR